MAIDFFQRPRYSGTNLPLATEVAPLAHVGAGGTSEHPAATTSVAGFMSAADKTKSDAFSTSSYYWFYYQTTQQLNITSATITKLNFDTIGLTGWNGGGNFATGTGLFTVPVTGVYQFGGGFGITPGVLDKEVRLYTYINGAGNYIIQGNHTSSAKQINTKGNIMLPLTQNDTVGLACWHDFAVNTSDIVAGIANTFFWGMLLRSL